MFIHALNDVFHTVSMRVADTLAIGAVGSLVLWAEELRTLVARHPAASQR